MHANRFRHCDMCARACVHTQVRVYTIVLADGTSELNEDGRKTRRGNMTERYGRVRHMC